jgi:hypothetical protein
MQLQQVLLSTVKYKKLKLEMACHLHVTAVISVCTAPAAVTCMTLCECVFQRCNRATVFSKPVVAYNRTVAVLYSMEHCRASKQRSTMLFVNCENTVLDKGSCSKPSYEHITVHVHTHLLQRSTRTLLCRVQ